MSMIDHTLDPLPKRADPHDHAQRAGRTWFSKETIYRARHYDDLSWARLAWPAGIGLALAASGQFLLSGDAALLAFIAAGIAGVMAVHGLFSKAMLLFQRPHS